MIDTGRGLVSLAVIVIDDPFNHLTVVPEASVPEGIKNRSMDVPGATVTDPVNVLDVVPV